MRRVIWKVTATLVAVLIMAAPAAECRQMDNLYDMLSEKGSVKVFLTDITDSSGGGKADLAHLEDALENALATRMSISFDIVTSIEEADIAIYCDILEFYWTDEDPVDMITGVGPVIMDAIKKDNYGRIQALFTVTDAGTGEPLWADTEKATITDSTMDEEESVTLLNARLVKVFMRECFARPVNRR